ncbi:MAG TPA: hypothetical protein VHB72_01710 [Candidatus Saccharimonadales bacterium]|nr:hypothetical protein [Candidatus Saccharimonadales bacterium]
MPGGPNFHNSQFMLAPDITGVELNTDVAAKLAGRVINTIGRGVYAAALDPKAWFIVDVSPNTLEEPAASNGHLASENVVSIQLATDRKNDPSEVYMAFMKGVMEHASSLGRLRQRRIKGKLAEDLLIMPRPLEPLLRKRRDDFGQNGTFEPRPGSGIVITV